MGNTIPVDLERQRRNKMGRPMRKANMGTDAGSIQVTSYRRVGEAESQTSGTPTSKQWTMNTGQWTLDATNNGQ